MIHYQLRCSDGHGFDGWFKDSASFDRQAKRGLVECPTCGGTKVERALMAPGLGRKSNAAAVAPPPAAKAVAPRDGVPDEMRALLQKLRAEVEKNAEHVGEGFADEARRIHAGEAPERAIYGDATPEQAEALADDGIEVARIPWVKRADG